MRRVGLAFVLWTLSMGLACSAPPVDSADPKQALVDESGSDWILDDDPAYKTVRFAVPENGSVALPARENLEDAVLAFLDRHKAAFGMGAPTSEWEHTQTTVDARGLRHLRFSQQSRGLTVHGAEWLATVDAEGRLSSMGGVYVPGLDALDAAASLTPSGAGERALADVQSRLEDIDAAAITTDVTPTARVYAAPGREPTVAFLVHTEVAAPAVEDASDYVIDGRSGAVLAWTATGELVGEGYGASHYRPYSQANATKHFPVSSTTPPTLDGRTPTGVRVQTRTRAGGVVTASSTSVGPLWSDATKPSGTAVDAQANLAAVVDVYKSRFGRDSYDDRGGTVTAIMNWNGNGRTNARYVGKRECLGDLRFGDGAPELGIFPPSASLDIVAHEYTHAVSHCIWGGSYATTAFETWAVDEAMSDIMAEIVTSSIEGGTPTEIGRGLSVEPDFHWRNLAEPHDPSSRVMTDAFTRLRREARLCDAVSDGSCGQNPHDASGVVSYAWYLMTEGGVHETNRRPVDCPLGWEASSRLWSHVLFHKLPHGPDFRAVALATLAAARDLSLPFDPVVCAWIATGVLETKDAGQWKVTCRGPGDATAQPAEDLTGAPLIQGNSQLLCPAVGSAGP
jgi:Zn-dependent metalloprotease